jgi:antitoxin component of MazEF toxin-antitoxin module
VKSKIQKVMNDYFVYIPPSLVEQLRWKDGDEIIVDTTLDCYPKGEVTSITLANITRHFDIVEESNDESKTRV